MAARRLVAALAFGVAACVGPAAPPTPLRVAVAPELESLQPLDRGLAHGGEAVLCNVYEGLVAFDSRMRVVPALAERWESPDELTWRFYLRRGVRFHDGRALEPADVVASLRRAKTLPLLASLASPAPGVVEIRTSRPEPMLLHDLVPAFVVPAARPDSGAIGTGPYRVTEYEPERHLRLSAVPDYWRGAAHEGTLEFLFERDPQRRLELLEAGTVDVALRLPEDAQAGAQAGLRLFARAAPGSRLLGLRVDRAPFSDPRLRRAIDLAIDREAIARDVLGSRAKPLGQLLPQGFVGYAPDLVPRSRDLAAARALVKQAGAAGLAVTLAHGAGRVREAERIAAQLDEAGFAVTLQAWPAAEISAALRRGDFALILWSVISYTGDANDVFGNVLHSPDAAAGWGEQNAFGYRSAELDRLVEQAALATPTSARLALFQQAMRVAMKDMALIPLWEVPWVTGVRDDVEFTPGADGWFWAYGAARRPRS